MWAYQYWHVDRNMKMAVAQLLELAKDVALLEITRIKNSIVDLDKSRVIVFDPENGELQFEIYLPGRGVAHGKPGWGCLFVGWLLNVPATCECISGTDLRRQFYVLPH